MAINLKIRTHGMIGWVASPKGDHMTGLLCKADRAVVPDQTVYVRFPVSSWDPNNQRATEGPPLIGLEEKLKNQRHVVLGRERITIDANPKRKHRVLSIFQDKDARSTKPTSADADSFFWIPDVEKLAPGHGDVNPAFFNDPTRVQPKLLARVDFTVGLVKTGGVERVQVPFRKSRGKTVLMPIARELLLEIEIEDDFFFLRSEGLDGSPDSSKDMRFQGTGELELVIGNEPAADIYRTTPPIDPIDVVSQKALEEFKHYYRLCAVPPKNPLLPHLAVRPGRETGCVHGRYKPSPLGVSSSMATPIEIPKDDPDWNVLAAIAADNDLVGTALTGLDQLEKADTSKVSVVVQADRASGTQRFVLEPGGLVSVGGELGNLNFGKAEVLTEFLTAGKKLRRAKYRAVFLSGHGTGIHEFVFRGKPALKDFRFTDTHVAKLRKVTNLLTSDTEAREDSRLLSEFFDIGPDSSAQDELTNQELDKGLVAALGQEGPFAILGLHACLMGMVEVALQLRKCARYLIASQDSEGVDDWAYDQVLGAFDQRVSPLTAAKRIVDIHGTATSKKPDATLSVVDLEKMDALAKSLDDLGKLLRPLVPGEMPLLIAARERARAFSNYEYVDLHGLVEAFRDAFGASRIQEASKIVTAANRVLAALAKAVVHTSKVPEESRAHGLSVYLPNAIAISQYSDHSIKSDARGWHAFVVAYGAAV